MTKVTESKKQKFEEIKELALKLFAYSIIFNSKDEYYATAKVEDVWTKAENFYDFIKQKEKEMLDETTGG